MSTSNTDSKSDSKQSLPYKPIVHVCTSTSESNVQGFIDALKSRYAGLLVQDVKYFQLPYNDIDSFSFRNTGIEVMILCHSINNRRFAITDVMDALYNKFLNNAYKALSRERICVLVHDMPWEKIDEADKYSDQMDVFRANQPSTFKLASLALIGGRQEVQDEEVQIRDGSWADLENFLKKAASISATAEQRHQWAVTHQPPSSDRPQISDFRPAEHVCPLSLCNSCCMPVCPCYRCYYRDSVDA